MAGPTGIVVGITGNTDGDVICSLLERPFRERSSEGKLAILKRNRPKPFLDIFIKRKPKKKDCGRFVTVWSVEYNRLWYTNFKWLCGSRETNKLYCWPCLLFHVKENVFTCGAVLTQNSLSEAAHAHDATNDHKSCVATLQEERERFGIGVQQNPVANNISIHKKEAYNDVVKKNRDLFKRIIELIMVFYKVDCALPYIASDVTHAVKFQTMFDLAIENDYYLREYSDELGDVYRNVIKSVFTDIMVCIKLELQCFSTSELVGSKTHPFWSLQVDGTNCINGIHSSSVILRYVDTSGNLQERHLGFATHSNKSAKSLFNFMSLCTEPIADNNYLVSQSYDGTCISVEEILDLQHKVTSVAPGALLVPSTDHSLNTVLLDSIANMSDGRRFVFILQDLLANNIGDSSFVYELLQMPILCAEHAHSILNSHLLRQILKTRHNVIQCYEQKRSSMDVPPEHLNKLAKFNNSLKDVKFVSFLLVFIEILKATEEIPTALNRDRTSVKTCSSVTKRVILKLKQIPSQKLTSDAYLIVTGLRKPISGTKAFENLVALHNSIIENAISQLSARFGDNYRQLAFLALVDSTKFASHNKTFPENALVSLTNLYKVHFKTEWLKDELKIFIYNDKQFYNKSPLSIIKLLIANDMKELLPESFKLFCLAAAMPIWSDTRLKSSCFERTSSFLQESRRFGIESSLRSELSSVVIDKPTVCQLAAQDSWHDKLIKRYATELNDYNLDLEFEEE